MSTYAIGDVQGCLTPLKNLLDKLGYQPEQDTLWFTGDLVNRGPDSLETLRFIKGLGKRVICVLGNHDLALLAAWVGAYEPSVSDTFQEILGAKDRDELCNWLKGCPLLHEDKKLGCVLIHAGIPPQWSVSNAVKYASEVETILRGGSYRDFLYHLFGDKPDKWDEALQGWERARYITNAFTRLRFCQPDGTLNLTVKGSIDDMPPGFMPWFLIPKSASFDQKIIFGHWAALMGQCEAKNVVALDSGCVWGNALTAICLETQERTKVPCKLEKKY